MFHPPYCPNPECDHHIRPQESQWYCFFSFYHTKAFGKVPRFRCKACNRTFSSQTFSIDYYAKKALSYRDIFDQITASAGLRDVARNLRVKHQAVRNRIIRMARKAVFSPEQILRLSTISENLVIDGLRSFSRGSMNQTP